MTYDIKFQKERDQIIDRNYKSKKFLKIARDFNYQASLNQYTYSFDWLGVPIIQYPQDIMLMQELIFEIKPDMIIETGIARSGSLILYSSLLSLIHKKYKVLGVDIEIRKHAKKVLKNHKFSKNIIAIEGSSNHPKTLDQILKISKSYNNILVCLDSAHTHQHVLDELKNYSKFVSKNSYIVVFDTTIKTFHEKQISKLAKLYQYKPFGKKSNPYTAISEFLKDNKNFQINDKFHKKALISNCNSGFLKRVK